MIPVPLFTLGFALLGGRDFARGKDDFFDTAFLCFIAAAAAETVTDAQDDPRCRDR
jgi:hypothetical protein